MEWNMICALLADIFEVNPDEITENTCLVSDLAADETDFEELRFALEEEFDIEIAMKEIKKNWETTCAGDVLRLVRKILQQNSGLHLV